MLLECIIAMSFCFFAKEIIKYIESKIRLSFYADIIFCV